MPSLTPLASGYHTVEDANGNAISGAKVKIYQAGLVSLATTWADAEGNTANDNPIICDASGRWKAFAAPGSSYDVEYYTAADVLLTSVDGIQAVPTPSSLVTFPAIQVPSADANTLDDYEEGAWVPVLGGSGGTTGQTYGLQVGRYVKVGRWVWFQGRVTLTAKGTITTNLQIQGLPFQQSAATALSTIQFGYFANMATNLLYMSGGINSSSTTATLYGTVAASTGGVAVLSTTDVGNTTDLIFSGFYEAVA